MKNNRNLKWIIGIVVVLLVGIGAFFFQSSHSQSENGKTKDTINVGVTGTSFPTAYKKDGKLTGFDVELIRLAGKKAGYHVNIVTGEFDGLLSQLDNGKLDTVANDIAITPERKQKYDFGKIYNKEETTIAVPKNTNYKNIKDLDGKVVSSAVASNNTANLRKYDDKINIKTFDARDLTYEALLSGKVDGVVNTRNNLNALIKEKNYDWKVVNGSAATVQIALPFQKNDQHSAEVKKNLDKAIGEMLKDGTVGKLSQKYFGYDETKDLK